MTNKEPEANSGQILRSILSKKINQNPHYSLRAFARALGLSPTYISMVLNNKRTLSLQRAIQAADSLRMEPKQRSYFLKKVALECAGTKKTAQYLKEFIFEKEDEQKEGKELFFNFDAEFFMIFYQWYHLPILDLTTCSHFQSDFKWVSNCLGIPEFTVKDAVDRLVRLGLMKIEKGVWIKTHKKIMLWPKKSETAVRQFHRQMIEKAMDCLEKTSQEEFSKRHFQRLTVAVNRKKLPKAVKLIEKFQKDLLDVLTEGDCDDLYQCNIQLFGLLKS